MLTPSGTKCDFLLYFDLDVTVTFLSMILISRRRFVITCECP